MKKVWFVFVALLGWSNMTMAASNVTDTPIIEAQELQFQLDLGDMSDMDATQIESEIQALFDAQQLASYGDLQCKVKVTGQVNIGVLKVTIEVEVSGSCAEISAHGKEVANMVLDAVKNELQKATIF